MKTITVTILVVLLAAMQPMAQSADTCLFEGITFVFQEDIDSFTTNYPGCTVIGGNVSIQQYFYDAAFSPITNLEGLSVLTHIGGDFSIGGGGPWSFGGLIDLTGLDNITSIGGNLEISGNPSLFSLNGLNNLTSVGGNLIIGRENGMWDMRANCVLSDISALSGLTSIGGELKICNNDTLASLSGLDNLPASSITHLNIADNPCLTYCEIQNICDYLSSPNGEVNIYNNAVGCNHPYEIASSCGVSLPCLPFGNYYFLSQSDIDNFQSNYPGCAELQGDLLITGDDISHLNGLDVITTISGNFEITSNPLLTNLEGLGNLHYIGGDLSLRGNSKLVNLLGLSILDSVGNSLYIRYIDSLKSLLGLENLSFIGKDLIIENCDSLKNINNLEGIHSLIGNITIADNLSLINFSGLDNLTTIGGDFIVNDNGALVNFSGLDNLFAIDGDLLIKNNDSLINLTGLNQLSTIGGGLMIGNAGDWQCSDNMSLTCLAGLENVNYIGGSLEICYQSSLVSLTGLEGLISIGNDASVLGNISLEGLTGLNNLNTIGGNFRLTGGTAFTSLSGLENLYSIIGNLEINNVDGLSDLAGLEELISVGGTLILLWNGHLLSLSGLENLNSIKGIYIRNNPALYSLTGLENIIADSLIDIAIFDNNSLCNCNIQALCEYLALPNGIIDIYNNAEGCSTPAEIGNECGISLPCLPYGNYYFLSQNDIDNFQTNYPGCTELAGNVEIDGDDIVNLAGLDAVTYVSGNLTVGSWGGANPNLKSLSGLENLTTVSGFLRISSNETLVNLSGLEGLNHIGLGLGIFGNNSLTNLNALENLHYVGELLYIGNGENDNPMLTSLAGLDNIDPVSINELNIRMNSSLSTCEVESICQHLSNPSGIIHIYDNAPGCNSMQEVLEACETLAVEELQTDDGISIYPNPCSGISSFGFRVAGSGHVTLKLYDMHGREVAMVVDGWFPPGEHKVNFDASGLPPGLYLLKVVAGEEVAVRKLVVSG